MLHWLCLILLSSSIGLQIYQSPYNAYLKLSAIGKLHAKEVASENMDWPNLGFGCRSTDPIVRYVYRNGVWGPVELNREEPSVQVRIKATWLHYGPASFEGLNVLLGQTKISSRID